MSVKWAMTLQFVKVARTLGENFILQYVLWCLYVGVFFFFFFVTLSTAIVACTVRILSGQLHRAGGAMWKAQPCVGSEE